MLSVDMDTLISSLESHSLGGGAPKLQGELHVYISEGKKIIVLIPQADFCVNLIFFRSPFANKDVASTAW